MFWTNDRGHRFVRYADDFSVYAKGKRAAIRIKASVSTYIKKALRLKVNWEKSKISRLGTVSLLGFRFNRFNSQWTIRISEKSVKSLLVKLRLLTRRNSVIPMPLRTQRIQALMRGWINYFKIAVGKTIMRSLDKLVRLRLRVILWKQWRTAGNRMRQLVKLGASKSQAYQHAKTRKSYTRTGNSPVLCTTLRNGYFARLGYERFLH